MAAGCQHKQTCRPSPAGSCVLTPRITISIDGDKCSAEVRYTKLKYGQVPWRGPDGREIQTLRHKQSQVDSTKRGTLIRPRISIQSTSRSCSLKTDDTQSRHARTYLTGRGLVRGHNETGKFIRHIYNRPYTTIQSIQKEHSVRELFFRPDLIRLPVLTQREPQAPLPRPIPSIFSLATMLPQNPNTSAPSQGAKREIK